MSEAPRGGAAAGGPPSPWAAPATAPRTAPSGEEGSPAPPSVVALGGGHGLSASLQALRHLTDRLTAVVTVADDGGSSGRLRRELGVLPPGDLRMALAALCDDADWGRTWRDVVQHRFGGDGELGGHAVGNLLIVALWELLGDQVAGLDWVAHLLGARGRVLPMSLVPLDVEGDVVPPGGGPARVVRGQVALATAAGRIGGVRLQPPDPPACPEAVEAVEEADWVVLGPGSWFTSVLPHLCVPELAAALVRTRARRCVVLNLTSSQQETAGLTAADHLGALARHAPDLRVDAVVADPRAVGDPEPLGRLCTDLGAQLLLRRVARSRRDDVHDPLRLAAAFRDAFEPSA
ncbi:uridine diphosphate-N-acetylglucosamine-binding protein YvcK [uncultured Pseudokineococcus sp.]|uniref:gluconeogenesis factor YvcK family protein n=1 Tax=uncultured Pseudokineococcus sp. TaxID=1642928 RepID=UPI002616A7CF|nr:uridine diphosphate-N-acetylglucosamine-binding protein YvcK [uncultured Pseudokineococcus sp.]